MDPILEQVPAHLRGLYSNLVQQITGLGLDVATHTTTRNRVFTVGQTFAELQPTGSVLRILIRPEGLGLAEGGSTEVDGVAITRVPDSHGWAVNHRIDVDAATPITGVIGLVNNSYLAVRQLRATAPGA